MNRHRERGGEWLQYHANHFFDKDYATDRLRIWDIAPLDQAALHRINSFNLSEKVAMSPFYKTITAIGTPDTLKSGICRAEYDMGPTLQNLAAFVDSKEHDPLLLSCRNRRIMQLLHIAEHGDLPGNYNRLDWIGTKLSHLAAPGMKDRYTGDTRLLLLKQTGTDAAAGKPHAVPSIPRQERTKRTQTL